MSLGTPENSAIQKLSIIIIITDTREVRHASLLYADTWGHAVRSPASLCADNNNNNNHKRDFVGRFTIAHATLPHIRMRTSTNPSTRTHTHTDAGGTL